MTAHELSYYRYLLGELKKLHTENHAKSVVLDSWKNNGRPHGPIDWRADVDTMTKDPMFRSAVEANMEPYFTRVQCGLNDASALHDLLRR
jgi:hypothetical protein